jgi:hypothetical protein
VGCSQQRTGDRQQGGSRSPTGQRRVIRLARELCGGDGGEIDRDAAQAVGLAQALLDTGEDGAGDERARGTVPGLELRLRLPLQRRNAEGTQNLAGTELVRREEETSNHGRTPIQNHAHPHHLV